MIKKPLVLQPPPQAIVVKRDLVYRTEGNDTLLADVYLPPQLGAEERRPVVIFIHGGPTAAEMKPKDWRIYADYGRLIASGGFVGVTFNHRFFSGADLGRAQTDVAALI